MPKNIIKPVSKLTSTMEPNKYRYACEGCTNVALLSSNKAVGIKVTCQSCGKEQTTKLENYIDL